MNKRIASLLAIAAIGLAAGTANAQISVSVGQPGFYGTIDIGGYPPPALVYTRPVVAVPGGYGGAPIYLHAPYQHIRQWDHYCARYGACGRPVYFVQDNWYNSVYVPRYNGRPYGPPPRGRGYDHHDRGHGHGHDDRGRGRDWH